MTSDNSGNDNNSGGDKPYRKAGIRATYEEALNEARQAKPIQTSATVVSGNTPQAQQDSQAAKASLVATPMDKGPRAPRAEKRRKKDGGSGWLSGRLGLFVKIFLGFSLIGLIVVIGLGVWSYGYYKELEEGLPDYAVLEGYEPQVTTRVHAGDGSLVAEFATERRLFVPIEDMPDSIKQAIISAEDKTFYEHGGIDFKGIIRAARNNVINKITGRGGSLQGASTITQQVAKNFLLSSDQKYERKFREMMIARRMERAFTKDQILELYLNEIYLGNRSYGMAAAALNYFDKSLKDLTVAEAAYLATLPKAPSNYHPVRNREKAIGRRNWIVGRMLDDGYLTQEEHDAAVEQDFTAKIAPPLGARKSDVEYFAEEVRKRVAERYGYEALYEGGLSVRTTLDPRLQTAAENAFRKWLMEYDQRHGWRGPVDQMTLPANLNTTIGQDSESDTPVYEWQSTLRARMVDLDKANKYAEDLAPWRLGVILSTNASSAEIGFKDGRKGTINLKAMKWAREYGDADHRGPVIRDVRKVVAPGDIVYADLIPEEGFTSPANAEEYEDDFPDLTQESGSDYALRQVPGVNGGFIAIDPHTGRVLAMVGGYSFGLSEFNRATQARRQPGSTFKPFVYAAALDNGYTPSSLVLDAPFVAPSLGDDWWKPGNYIAGRFYGESTLRLGIEKSRNTMTARLAQDIGIGLIIRYAERFGVSDKLPRELAISLGAGETTLIDLTTAYAMFVNGGRNVEPVLIDRVQDRYGKTIYRRDTRQCFECLAGEWSGQAEPQVPDNREQVIDPRTAYQMVSILEGVVARGTGTRVKRIIADKPLAGKTGTTDEYRDAWFVGFSPDLAAGVYVGFDLPSTMGQGEGGGIVAAPVFGEFMKEAIGDLPATPFRAPSGIRLVRVNSKTGKPALPSEANVILEAFKAEDDIYGTSRTDDGTTDEGIDDDLGGLY